MLQSVTAGVRDRRTNVADRVARWTLDYDVVMEETSASFASFADGTPDDVKTAEKELKAELDRVTKEARKCLKVFDDMNLAEMTQQHQDGNLDLKKRLLDASTPVTESSATFNKVR